MYRVDIYINGNGDNTSKYCCSWAFRMEYKKRDNTIHSSEGLGVVEGTRNKATLTAINKALKRLNHSCEVHIHCENSFIVNMFNNHLEKWDQNGYLKANGEPVANKVGWQWLWQLSRGHKVIMEAGKHKYSK